MKVHNGTSSPEKIKTEIPERNSGIYINLDAFINEIREGDSEWFERIARRESAKRKANRTSSA